MNNEIKKRLYFVIMPIGSDESKIRKDSDDTYDLIIEPAVTEFAKENGNFEFDCLRADKVREPNNIIKDITRKLYDANVVIADLSNQNPNVFYELGVRHSLVGRTIMITNNLKDVPFDLRAYRVIEYDLSARGAEKAKKAIKECLDKIETNPNVSDNPVFDLFHGIPIQGKIEKEPEKSNIKQEVAILRQMIERLNYNFQVRNDQLTESKSELNSLIEASIEINLKKFAEDITPTRTISLIDIARRTGIADVYERRDDARKRILELLPKANKNVQLIGISLRRFFHHGSEINEHLRSLSGNSANWQALVIDPECEQALLRSLREHESFYMNTLGLKELNYSHMNYTQLFEKFGETYKKAQLWTDLKQTIHNVQIAEQELGFNVSLRLYHGAPTCFLAIIDDHLLVEQYHYGAMRDERLSEQVPVFEFKSGTIMYQQLRGHFEHMWKRLSREPEKEKIQK